MTYSDFIEEEILKELRTGNYITKIANWYSAKWNSTEVIIYTFKGHRAYYSGGTTTLLISKNNFKVVTKKSIGKDIKHLYTEYSKGEEL